MPFRSIGQRDDRRRRFFSDGQWGVNANARRRPHHTLGWAKPVRKSDHYGDAEFLDQLPRAIDLLPTRLPALLLLLLLGLGVVAGLVALHHGMPGNLMAVNGRVEAFDLKGQGNLAVWFSSMSLALGGMLALVVYSVRRHRTDDYHGHYRVWLWAALCCFLLSMEQTANLRDGLAQLATRLTGTPLYGDGSAWWLLAYGFLFGAVGTRLLIDVIADRVSVMALLGAVGCYGLCAACRFHLVVLREDAWQVMAAVGAQLLGNLLLLAAIGFHVRHVLLDAEGLLPRRRPRLSPAPVEEDEESEPEESESEEEPPRSAALSRPSPTIVVHPPQGIPRPMGVPTPATPPISPAPPVPPVSSTPPTLSTQPASPGPPKSIAEAEATLKRKLTKTERKALRQRLEKLQAERRKRAG